MGCLSGFLHKSAWSGKWERLERTGGLLDPLIPDLTRATDVQPTLGNCEMGDRQKGRLINLFPFAPIFSSLSLPGT